MKRKDSKGIGTVKARKEEKGEEKVNQFLLKRKLSRKDSKFLENKCNKQGFEILACDA